MNINLSETLREQLDAEAERQGVTLSALIREACEHWLSRHALSSGSKTAKPGAAKWKYLWERGGTFIVETSKGDMAKLDGLQVTFSRRGTGSAGRQKCYVCGEMFDAGIGSYSDRGIYLCTTCSKVLLAQAREVLQLQEDAQDLRAIDEVAGEATSPWERVKAKMRQARETKRAG